ncbi:hypothetical protein KP509_26G047700 [Ceratopteris richardii]|uniref:Uncharacterized protein n=1 Tax=Ceratopteris richardii TaxID=49495 RepID=A0A8T2RKP6_CERRI|nr:hypothetical protein KP509_26G047700 [Ceratopteris richardii]
MVRPCPLFILDQMFIFAHKICKHRKRTIRKAHCRYSGQWIEYMWRFNTANSVIEMCLDGSLCLESIQQHLILFHFLLLLVIKLNHNACWGTAINKVHFLPIVLCE